MDIWGTSSAFSINLTVSAVLCFISSSHILITRGDQTLTWDVENRLIAVTQNSTVIAQFFYDGNGNRIKKIENGETILYINRYYEKNLTTGNITTSYYLGGQLVATKENDVLRYVHQDHLTGTSLMTNASGTQIGQTMKYLPFGETLSGSVPTDKKYTGQRLDETGLYYYNARYYDATIGRFTSADIVIQSPANPQTLNRYSYALNNPLKYVDPSGNVVIIEGANVSDIENSISSGNYMQILAYYSNPLVQAYGTLHTIAPMMTQALEKSLDVIPISFKNLNAGGGFSCSCLTSTTLGQTPREAEVVEGVITSIDVVGIYVDNSLKDDMTQLMGTLAEESFHALMGTKGFFSNSRFEEFCAESYNQYAKHAYVGESWNGGSGIASLTPDMSYNEIQESLNADFWNPYPSYRILKNEPTEGSFSLMWFFYKRYYPG